MTTEELIRVLEGVEDDDEFSEAESFSIFPHQKTKHFNILR